MGHSVGMRRRVKGLRWTRRIFSGKAPMCSGGTLKGHHDLQAPFAASQLTPWLQQVAERGAVSWASSAATGQIPEKLLVVEVVEEVVNAAHLSTGHPIDPTLTSM